MLTALAVAVAVLGTVVGWWTGLRVRTRFMAHEEVARTRLLTFHAEHPGGLVWSSLRGWDRLQDLFPNPAETRLTSSVQPATARVGQPVVASIAADRGQLSRVWGVAIIDFGDREAGDPAFDVANFLLWEDEQRLTWLRDGYGDAGDDFDTRVWVFALADGLRLAHKRYAAGRIDAADPVVKQLLPRIARLTPGT